MGSVVSAISKICPNFGRVNTFATVIALIGVTIAVVLSSGSAGQSEKKQRTRAVLTRHGQNLALLEIEIRKEAGPDVQVSFEKHNAAVIFATKVLLNREGKKKLDREDRDRIRLLQDEMGQLQTVFVMASPATPVRRISDAVEAIEGARDDASFVSENYSDYPVDLSRDEMDYVSNALLEYIQRVSSLDNNAEVGDFINVCMDSRTGAILLFVVWPEYVNAKDCRPLLIAFRDALRRGQKATSDAAKRASEEDSKLLGRFADSLGRRQELLEILCSDTLSTEIEKSIRRYLDHYLEEARRNGSNLP